MNTMNLYDEMSKTNELDFVTIPLQFFQRGQHFLSVPSDKIRAIY